MKIRLLFFLFLLSPYSILEAQVTKDTTWNRSEFVEDTDEYLSLKLNANNDIDRILIDGDQNFTIKPNATVRNNFSLNYKWLTVGVTFDIPNLYGLDEAKGQTKTNDFRLSLNPDKWSFTYHYKRNIGYYLENSRDFLPPGSNEYILFPNLKTRFHRFYIGHIVNSKFSLKSLTTFTERQLQNSGSFIPFIRMTYFNLDIDNPTFGKENADNFEAVIGTSYSHKFILKKYFYAAVVGSIGYGYLSSNISDLSIIARDSKTNYSSDIIATQIGGSAGYNGPRFFAGLNFNSFNNTSAGSGDSYTLDTRRSVWEVFIGYRVRIPKFLRKPLNWADEQKEKVIK